MNAGTKTHSISRRVIISFCLFALLMSAVFSFMSFLFLFAVEDEFLERDLHAERGKLTAAQELMGAWPEPGPGHMTLYHGVEALPGDMRDQYKQEPERREFYGEEGRHYHLAHMAGGAFLVAEVSDRLLIRPLRGTIVSTFLVLTTLLTAVGCLIAYRLARRSIAPLSELATFVEGAVPEKLPNDFSGHYPPNEVGILAKALEKSLQRIGLFIKREQNFNRDVSHDLRTPIAVVSGSVEVLKKRYTLEPPVAELVDRIDIANRHMASTVEALLSLAREEGANRFSEKIKVLPVLEKTVLQFSHLLEGKEVEVLVDVAPDASLKLQQGVLEILLGNLLGNAFEYSEKGMVRIGFDKNTLTISDTGGGVDEQMRDVMFEEKVKSGDSSGFGRGLSIVKRVCDHHGIGIHVDHQPGGTEICLDFDKTEVKAVETESRLSIPE